MEYLALIFALAAFAMAIGVRGRLRDVETQSGEHRINELARQNRLIEQLFARVMELERAALHSVAVERTPAAAPVSPAPESEPVRAPAAVTVPEPAPEPVPEPLEEPIAPPIFFRPAEPPPPSLPERIRHAMGGDEWEALVGGSLLNKLGAFILVIGIALFLGFSFTRMGPGGRAFLSFLISSSLLATGILVERKPRYQAFSRGLIGAGWAALYATSYAIWAVSAARVIENPLVGSLVMLVVAAGMIAHSLRYRAQAITAVAFFAAFGALAVTPSSGFGVVATIPLAASLLYLADRFRWYSMALFGMAATYLTCVAHGSSGASLAATETLFVLYWLLFEAFDILRARRRELSGGVVWIFPGNAVGFLGLSYLLWESKDPAHLWLISAIAAALYLGSAIARRPTSFAETDPLPTRLAAGSFEGPFLLSAVLGGLAIAGRVPGLWKGVGLATEAEIVYLAGVRLESAFLRNMGARAFVFSLFRLFVIDLPEQTQRVPLLGLSIQPWTPPAIFHVFLFYLNRKLRTPNVIFSSSAAAILTLVLAVETPQPFAGLALLLLAAVLFEIGLRGMLLEFRFQAYAVALAGVIFALGANSIFPARWSWVAVALSLMMLYSHTARTRQLKDNERTAAEFGIAGGTVLLAALLLYRVVPPGFLGLSLLAASVLFYEAGRRAWPAALRYLSFASVAVAAIVTAATHNTDYAHFPKPAVWLSFWAAAACLHWMGAREPQGNARNFLAGAGTLFLLPAIWLSVPETLVAAAWSTLAILLVFATRQTARQDLHWQALAVAGTAFVWAFFLPAPIAFAALTPALVYALQFSLPTSRARSAAALLATVLVTKLLFDSVNGSLLTVAWGAEGLILLGAGFPTRERILRLAGLTLFLVCILKLFLYDLRNLETMYRILSFVALGLILLGVSWLYTRFRERIGRYL